MALPGCLELAIRVILLTFKNLWPINFPEGWGSFSNMSNIGTIIFIFLLIMLFKTVIKPGGEAITDRISIINVGTITGGILTLMSYFGLFTMASHAAGSLGRTFALNIPFLSFLGNLAFKINLIIGVVWIILLLISDANSLVKFVATPLVFLASLLTVIPIIGPLLHLVYGSLIGNSSTSADLTGLAIIIIFIIGVFFHHSYLGEIVCPSLSNYLSVITATT